MSSAGNLVVAATSDHVMTIRMNRAEKKNALTLQMYDALADVLEAAAADDTVLALRIAGVPGAFSAGNDILDFVSFAETGALGEPVVRFLKALASSAKPLVAAVDGLAIGIGTTMLLHCDYVVATPRARFQTPFTDLALVPEAASSLIAPRLMGHQRAFALLAMGERMTAAEAERAGFVNRVVEPDELDAASGDAARTIARKPVAAMAATRALLRGDRTEILARIDAEAMVFRQRLQSDEALAAFAAFTGRAEKGNKVNDKSGGNDA